MYEPYSNVPRFCIVNVENYSHQNQMALFFGLLRIVDIGRLRRLRILTEFSSPLSLNFLGVPQVHYLAGCLRIFIWISLPLVAHCLNSPFLSSSILSFPSFSSRLSSYFLHVCFPSPSSVRHTPASLSIPSLFIPSSTSSFPASSQRMPSSSSKFLLPFPSSLRHVTPQHPYSTIFFFFRPLPFVSPFVPQAHLTECHRLHLNFCFSFFHLSVTPQHHYLHHLFFPRPLFLYFPSFPSLI